MAKSYIWNFWGCHHSRWMLRNFDLDCINYKERRLEGSLRCHYRHHAWTRENNSYWNGMLGAHAIDPSLSPLLLSLTIDRLFDHPCYESTRNNKFIVNTNSYINNARHQSLFFHYSHAECCSSSSPVHHFFTTLPKFSKTSPFLGFGFGFIKTSPCINGRNAYNHTS